MKGRPVFSKNKILVALVALFTMLMCVSVGFATWITTGGSNSSINGTIDADDVVSGGDNIDCITITSTSGPGYYNDSNGQGFVDKEGLYNKKSGTLSFVAVINLASARTVIPTLNSAGNFNFIISLSTNVSISGLTAAMDTDSPLVLKSNYATNVAADIPAYGSPTSNTLGTNELINVTYPISHLSKTNHSQLTITGNMVFTFASDVFSSEITNLLNGNHKFVIKLGAS